jgi:hypothetical protein
MSVFNPVRNIWPQNNTAAAMGNITVGAEMHTAIYRHPPW